MEEPSAVKAEEVQALEKAEHEEKGAGGGEVPILGRGRCDHAGSGRWQSRSG